MSFNTYYVKLNLSVSHRQFEGVEGGKSCLSYILTHRGGGENFFLLAYTGRGSFFFYMHTQVGGLHYYLFYILTYGRSEIKMCIATIRRIPKAKFRQEIRISQNFQKLFHTTILNGEKTHKTHKI